MNFILLALAYTVFNTGQANSTPRALIYFVASFALSSVAIVCQGNLFLGLSYVVVYIGAVAVVYVFAILLIDSYQTGLTGAELSPASGLVLSATLLYLIMASSLGTAPSTLWPSLEGIGLLWDSDLESLSDYVFSDNSLGIILLGLILVSTLVAIFIL